VALFDIPGFDSAADFSAFGDGSGVGVLTAEEMNIGIVGGFHLPAISVEAAQVSSREATLDLPVPAGAEVTQAIVRIAASAPGRTGVGGIADVRAAAGDVAATDDLIIDFGVLRSVSGVQAPSGFGIYSVTPWIGTMFDGGVFFEGPDTSVDFTEIQAERLLVSLDDDISPADFATSAFVRTSTPPADLELLVAGTRVSLHQGPAPVGFSEDVDITSATQAAIASTPAGTDGMVHVPVVLRARVPGTLELSLVGDIHFLRTLVVDFPGPTKTVRFGEEGTQAVELPLPSGGEVWTIHRVVAALAADDPGPVRVLPPIGPTVTAQAELVFDPNRRLVARLPSGPLDRFASVAGVRILLTVDTSGIEVGGALLGGSLDEPGEPIADATFTPVAVPAATSPAWVTVPLAQPIQPPVDVDALWASFSVTRGKAVLALADQTITDAGDVTRLKRIAPNGIAHSPSTVVLRRDDTSMPAVPVGTDALAMRVVGIAPDEAPVAVADVDLAGGPTVRAVATPGSVAISPNPAGSRSPLALNVTATTATAVTIGPVVVAYTEGTS
jgi:hypothetical protein